MSNEQKVSAEAAVEGVPEPVARAKSWIADYDAATLAVSWLYTRCLIADLLRLVPVRAYSSTEVPDAEWKIMTDAEWEGLSAESRFRINEFMRTLLPPSLAVSPVTVDEAATQQEEQSMTSFEESTQELRESIEDFKKHLVHEDDEPEVITRLRQQCDDMLRDIGSAEFEEVCW